MDASRRNDRETEDAMSTIAGAMRGGKVLTDEELKDLAEQIENDEEAMEAVEVLTNSLGDQPPVVKYCPLTGKRYSGRIETCPEHGVVLEVVE